MIRAKKCTSCGIKKSTDAFNKHKANSDGLQRYCKSCQQKLIKAWRENNTEYRKQYDEQYREKHREERREYNRQWRKQNKEYWRSYQNERLRTDPDYRLRNYIGRAIRKAINKDRKSVFHLLGYSVDELRHHLESLFQPGMTWDNYGTEWHIDHKTPKSWFKLEGENGVDLYELRLCWSLLNLQPMWVGENLEKKNRYISDIRLGKSFISYVEFRALIEAKKDNDILEFFFTMENANSGVI